ncbi:MAG: dihydrodipicolinate synthase family protein [Planctomycetota bacterium]
MSDTRRELIQRLFPDGLPRLWCPPLTHFADDGGLDRERMAAHLATLAPHVKGMLVPGSTGEAWEMDSTEARELLHYVLDLAGDLGFQVLVGALHPDAAVERQMVSETMAWLRERSGEGEDLAALDASRVCGFAVCPPRGAGRTQQEIRDALAAVLQFGLPTALYQLPQVTECEMAPETVADLAGAFDRLYLVKDSSGGDRVATSGLVPDDVFLVRGAETDYLRWYASAGGPYGGFLLSTANCFAPLLTEMIEQADAGRLDRARLASEQVSRAIAGVFALVDDLPWGNRYTNANKAIDHFLAHGPAAGSLQPPLLHSGVRLPQAVIEATGAHLAQLGLMPAAGYLEA